LFVKRKEWNGLTENINYLRNLINRLSKDLNTTKEYIDKKFKTDPATFPKDSIEQYFYISYKNDENIVWYPLSYVIDFQYEKYSDPNIIKGKIEFLYKNCNDELIKLLQDKKMFDLKIEIHSDLKDIVSEIIHIDNIKIIQSKYFGNDSNDIGNIKCRIYFEAETIYFEYNHK
jgi:hypothetical protein